MAPWLASLLPGALGRVFDFAEGWQERRKQETEARHEARLEQIRQRNDGWKDEYILVVCSYPLVSLFIPPLRESTMASIDYLVHLPGWMVGCWVGIVAAVYGFQKVPKVKK